MDAPLSFPKTKWTDFLNHLATTDKQNFEKEIPGAIAKLDAKAESIYKALAASARDVEHFHMLGARIQLLPAGSQSVIEAWSNVQVKYLNLQRTFLEPIFANPVLSAGDIQHLTDNLVGVINILKNDRKSAYHNQLANHFRETHCFLRTHPNDPRYYSFFRLCRKIHQSSPLFLPLEIQLCITNSYRIHFKDSSFIDLPSFQYLVLRGKSEKLRTIPLNLKNYHSGLEINRDQFKKLIKYCYDYPGKLETLKVEDLVNLLQVAHTLGNDRQMEIICDQLKKRLLNETQPELAFNVETFSIMKRIKSINETHPQLINLYDVFLRTLEKAFLTTPMTVERLKFILDYALSSNDPVLIKMCQDACHLHWASSLRKVTDAIVLKEKNMFQVLREQFERLILLAKIGDKTEDKTCSDRFRQIVILVLTLNEEKICKELIDKLKNRFPEYTPQVATFDDADKDWELQAPLHAIELEFKFIPSYEILKHLVGLNITKIKFPRQNIDTLKLTRAFPIQYVFEEPQEYQPTFFEKLFLP